MKNKSLRLDFQNFGSILFSLFFFKLLDLSQSTHTPSREKIQIKFLFGAIKHETILNMLRDFLLYLYVPLPKAGIKIETLEALSSNYWIQSNYL